MVGENTDPSHQIKWLVTIFAAGPKGLETVTAMSFSTEAKCLAWLEDETIWPSIVWTAA
jgi:hypothetical protein